MHLRIMLPFAFVLFCMLVSTKCSEDKLVGGKWGYHHDKEEERPENWYKSFKDCGGKRQSPIHFYSKDMKYDPALTDVTFLGYEKMTQNATIYNNGHTVFIIMETDKSHHIKGAGLDGEYILHSFHLHWGSGNENGSEHWLDSTHYAAEVHYVHYKTKYANISDAIASRDGSALAVIGTLIKIEGSDNPAFNDVIKALKEAPYNDEEASVQSFRLDRMLPSNLKTFYRYDGSLTTPTCDEIVVWTVYDTPVLMSQNQISEFRKLHSIERKDSLNITIERSARLLDNFRPPQPMYGRIVTTNDDPTKPTQGSPALCSHYISLLVVLGLLTYLL